MNILYIAEDISLPGFHGGSTHTSETINSLVELGHNVTIICKKEPKQKDIEIIDKIKYIRLALPKKSLQKNWILFFNLGKIVSEILKKEKIDLVWERNRIFGNQGIIVGKKHGCKTLIEMHEPINMFETNKTFLLIKKWFFHTIKFADKVYIQHKNEGKGIEAKKLILSSNGANPKKFNPKISGAKISKKLSKKKFRFFYSGSFQPWHCLDKTILAFNKINNTNKDLEFLLAGEGPQKDKLQKLVKSKKINNVVFLGNIEKNKLAAYINKSNACLALFDREYPPIKKYDYFYSPVKVFEYLACKKPIIASNIGNLKKILSNNINGLLVNEQNVNEISSAMQKLINNNKLLLKLGENNLKEFKSKYTWDKINTKIIEAFK